MLAQRTTDLIGCLLLCYFTMLWNWSWLAVSYLSMILVHSTLWIVKEQLICLVRCHCHCPVHFLARIDCTVTGLSCQVTLYCLYIQRTAKFDWSALPDLSVTRHRIGGILSLFISLVLIGCFPKVSLKLCSGLVGIYSLTFSHYFFCWKWLLLDPSWQSVSIIEGVAVGLGSKSHA